MHGNKMNMLHFADAPMAHLDITGETFRGCLDHLMTRK